MKSKKVTRIVSFALAATLGAGAFAMIAGCTQKADSLIIMTQELNGLFNPFYSTAGTDMDVVGQTQISMFTTDSKGEIACGDKEAVVVKDYEVKNNGATTDYTFVIKNGIKFSDGEPLTMNDILFSMYVLLDPAYTGSTTMYSTKIVGLQSYRTQQISSSDGSTEDAALTTAANGRVTRRIQELVNLYRTTGQIQAGSTNYDADEAKMKEAIANHNPSSGYKGAIAVNGDISTEDARAQLLEDYEHTLELFKEELNNDYNAAKDAYKDAPYTNKDGNVTNHTDVKFDNGLAGEIVSFMYYEGYYEVEYNKVTGANGKQRDDTNDIRKLTPLYDVNEIKTKEQAIQKVYDDNVASAFDSIITSWASTSSTIRSEFSATAKDVFLHERLGSDAKLVVENIEGIRSLGHRFKKKDNATGEYVYEEPISTVNVNGKEYAVATTHNDDGTPAKANEYDVLRITINGTDPKAIWNFGFTVAPHHYYSDPVKYPVNIENNQFGVDWASFDFHSQVIQGANSYGESKNKVPLGAGPYIASDRNNSDRPTAAGFIENDQTVFYKANELFFKDVQDADESLHAPIIEKMRYQVISQTNALNRLENGAVHFVEPQYTKDNAATLQRLKKQGIEQLDSWQLGYGYIGVNARYVPDVNLRRAIMSAMDISRSLEYYVADSADTINWPMSLVSWAYPRSGATNPNNLSAGKDENNNHDYTMFTKYYKANGSRDTEREDAEAISKIEHYMQLANVSAGDEKLHIKFTIAGSNLTDHPCYTVFLHAKQLLDSCGWNIEINPDTYALVKLATGSLAVWAAAWGSTIDPDMYQVYHKNSTATSVLSWGYREILADPSTYSYENGILTQLSTLIDQARTIESDTQAGKDARSAIYRNAMSYVLDLAVELPVYQRKTLYAFNSNVIDVDSLPKDDNGKILNNPYASPLSRIWELKLKG